MSMRFTKSKSKNDFGNSLSTIKSLSKNKNGGSSFPIAIDLPLVQLLTHLFKVLSLNLFKVSTSISSNNSIILFFS